jgi:hypothetical protein
MVKQGVSKCETSATGSLDREKEGTGSTADPHSPGMNIGPCGKQSVDNISISSFSRKMQRSVLFAEQYKSVHKGVILRMTRRV